MDESPDELRLARRGHKVPTGASSDLLAVNFRFTQEGVADSNFGSDRGHEYGSLVSDDREHHRLSGLLGSGRDPEPRRGRQGHGEDRCPRRTACAPGRLPVSTQWGQNAMK